jgi:hypothetical protein
MVACIPWSASSVIWEPEAGKAVVNIWKTRVPVKTILLSGARGVACVPIGEGLSRYIVLLKEDPLTYYVVPKRPGSLKGEGGQVHRLFSVFQKY